MSISPFLYRMRTSIFLSHLSPLPSPPAFYHSVSLYLRPPRLLECASVRAHGRIFSLPLRPRSRRLCSAETHLQRVSNSPSFCSLRSSRFLVRSSARILSESLSFSLSRITHTHTHPRVPPSHPVLFPLTLLFHVYLRPWPSCVHA